MPSTVDLGRVIRAVSEPFVSFLFPPACLACNAPMERSDGELCSDCGRQLRRVRNSDAIYLQTFGALVGDRCLDGLEAPFYFEKAGPLQSMIHQLKYGGMTRVGVRVGVEIAHQLDRYAGRADVVIVPVPLHATKLRERGYNQSWFIGRGIGKALQIELLPRAIRRVVDTQSQTTLDSAQRAKNVAGVFQLSRGAAALLQGKTVLLVDDVITTGATVRSCASTLRESGVEAIIACAAALAM